ncbi:hypothetical protein F4809DRAFT_504053 [Biscogniauxia mediterranea]|nr:hypothetical protein F4809DRAFT_504053 [Biscogniauxia mediterranea]
MYIVHTYIWRDVVFLFPTHSTPPRPSFPLFIVLLLLLLLPCYPSRPPSSPAATEHGTPSLMIPGCTAGEGGRGFKRIQRIYRSTFAGGGVSKQKRRSTYLFTYCKRIIHIKRGDGEAPPFLSWQYTRDKTLPYSSSLCSFTLLCM